eukprot:c24068_g3_i1 orf=444-1955(-)
MHPAKDNENKREDPKAAACKGGAAGNGKAPMVVSNNRRTLGDISNLVGGLPILPAQAITAKAETSNAVKNALVVERPVTRSFGAQLASNHVHNQPLAAAALLASEPTRESDNPKSELDNDPLCACGTKQKRTTKSKDENALQGKTNVPIPLGQNAATAVDSKSSIIMPPGHPARMKALLNNRNGKTGVQRERRGQTLTATLTARSEAACGVIESNKVDTEEPIPSIDDAEIGNPLAVVDYVEDIYSFYRKSEMQSCVAPDYMSSQAEINDKMRAILIDWLIEVHLKFKLMPETLFLTTNVIDRYLSMGSVVARKNLQLVGMTAMLVAAKYEEIWAPEIQDFVFISDNAYTKQQILDMEKLMLNTLRFNLTVPTPYVFIVRFLKAAASDKQMDMLAFFLVELSLVNYIMVKFPPSMLAAAAVYTAQCTLQRSPSWSRALRHHSGYTEAQLKDCAILMVSLHQKAGEENQPLTVVHRKYSHSKFYSVATLTPATLPTDDCESLKS